MINEKDDKNLTTESALAIISQNPNYKVLKKVPEEFEKIITSSQTYSAMIIDLETMGLDPRTDKIIEIGLIKFSFTEEDGIIEVLNTYSNFNDPHMPISEETTELTGITSADVKDQAIDWKKIAEHLEDCDMIICHNSKFDRKFLEIQTPDFIQKIIKAKAFACTIQDINWLNRGYKNCKLDYLNFKLGFFYEPHRALNDCWATLNLLREVAAFVELRSNMKKTEILLWAEGASFEKNELLKGQGYKFFNGSHSIQKCWQKYIKDEAALREEMSFLEDKIYRKTGACNKLPIVEITAKNRYSFRSETASLRLSELFPSLTRVPQIAKPAPTFIISATPSKENKVESPQYKKGMRFL